MVVPLKPELERFIEDQVRSGRFASAAEVVEVALAHLMVEAPAEPPDELDEETLAAIAEADAQLEGGEGRPWKSVREELRSM